MEEKTIYIHETQSMSCDNGELYIEGEFGSIIWNCESLFTDLPYIIKMTLESRAKTDKFVREQIAEITKLISE